MIQQWSDQYWHMLADYTEAIDNTSQLASWLIYSYAFNEYISSFGCWSNIPVLFRDVTVSEIRRKKVLFFFIFREKC